MAAQKNSKRNEMTTILATLENRLTQLFGARYQEVMRINQIRKAIDAGQEFKFDSSPAAARQMVAIISQLAMQASSLIKQGDKEAWEAGDKNASRTLAATFGKTTDGQKTLDALTERGKEDMRARGATAEQHYRNREESVAFSTSVWKEQAQKDLELIIQNGIKQGKSAEQISRDIRPYLNNPNAYYRRVRNKETGELELSEAAKKYKPGRGVYRSAFKNALRLARTEVNIAYATAQWESFQSNPLVTGIRISLSNNHTVLDSKGKPQPLYDMCDELQGDYPKTFRWTPWHPQCRCTMTPITISDDDFKKRMRALFTGTLDDWKPQDTVTKMPETFTGWMDRNKERLAKGKNIPAFVKDNYLKGNPLAKLNPAITELEAEVRKQAPTPEYDNKTKKAYSLAKAKASFIDEDPTILEELYNTGDKERMLQEAERINAKTTELTQQLLKMRRVAKQSVEEILTTTKDNDITREANRMLRTLDKVLNFKYDRDKVLLLMADTRRAQVWADEQIKKLSQPGGTFDERLEKRESIEQLLKRLGKDAPATLRNMAGVLRKSEQDAMDDAAWTPEEKKILIKNIAEVLKKHDFGTNCDATNLESILKNGLKSQLETGTTGGALNPGFRRVISETLFGTEQKTAASEYEKYGSLLHHDKEQSLKSLRGGNGLSGYGQVEIRLKKDDVIATWTMGDSLDDSDILRPSLTTDPRVCSYGTARQETKKGPWECHTLKGIRESWKSTGSPETFANHFENSYIELQFHGKVTAKQIESISFAFEQEARQSLPAIQKALQLGIKVYVLFEKQGLQEITWSNISLLNSR